MPLLLRAGAGGGHYRQFRSLLQTDRPAARFAEPADRKTPGRTRVHPLAFRRRSPPVESPVRLSGTPARYRRLRHERFRRQHKIPERTARRHGPVRRQVARDGPPDPNLGAAKDAGRPTRPVRNRADRPAVPLGRRHGAHLAHRRRGELHLLSAAADRNLVYQLPSAGGPPFVARARFPAGADPGRTFRPAVEKADHPILGDAPGGGDRHGVYRARLLLRDDPRDHYQAAPPAAGSERSDLARRYHHARPTRDGGRIRSARHGV